LAAWVLECGRLSRRSVRPLRKSDQLGIDTPTRVPSPPSSTPSITFGAQPSQATSINQSIKNL